jgi:UTP:GlnB (protein PII) uridylyltransferase
VRTRDLLAVYAAGGHGRKLAFDDDYDLIILLNSEDPEIRDYCGKIMARMNSEIIKRGTMPQYRFAERFGNYVTTFKELTDLFETPDEVTFIDMSQLMGARKIVGSEKFEAELYRRIIRPFILDDRDRFVAQIAGEIRSRHQAVDQGVISPLDIKETKGGLRDIELLLLILMAKSDLWLPVTQELYAPLAEGFPHRAGDLKQIFKSFRDLKHVRDIYRLTVAAEDVLLPEELDFLAQVLGYGDEAGGGKGPRKLVESLVERTEQVSSLVYSLLDELDL